MNFKMFKRLNLLVFLCIALLLAFCQAPRQCYGLDGIEIGIDLAQSLINLQSTISVITFHTTIRYNNVACETVILTANTASVPVYYCSSDSRGYLKAHFLMQDIKAIRDYLEIGIDNLFVLEGETKDGISFYGLQSILVGDIKPYGR